MAASLAAVRAVPVWVWLVGLVAVSTAVRYALARRIVAPWIMVDELIYSELAKSFASSGHFLVRDQATAAYGLVYPVLISPAWALFSAVPTAYAAAKAINALLMSLAAVPTYFLARRVLEPVGLARRRGARARGAVDGLQRHADDRERVLPGLHVRGARDGALA